MCVNKDSNEINKTYYPNGELEMEVVQWSNRRITRFWHENGVLEKEVPTVDGLADGLVRQWDANGELLDAQTFQMGTGLVRVFFSDGKVRSECHMSNGVPNGRILCWDEDGDLTAEQYFVMGRKVRKHKYLELCSQDSSLPIFSEAEQVQGTRPVIEEAQNEATHNCNLTSDRTMEDEIVEKLFDGGSCHEANKWLMGGAEFNVERSFGESRSLVDSMELVRLLQANGVSKLFAVDDNGNTQSSNILIAEIEHQSHLRSKAFDLANAISSEAGYSPTRDIGQKYLFIALD